jgi:hypothetical protein
MSRSSRTSSPVLPMYRFNSFFREPATKEPYAAVEPILKTATDAKFKQWKPFTLRRPFLIGVILITLGLLALVQLLVIYDQHYDGILFASKISKIGAGHLFLYRYLPTILAVTYAFIWHWIDVDTRRIEPYRQLSKPGGATGSNSLLLHYPTDLLAFVPLKALKRKHWPVVISASALLLVGMGLTPLQAAMFATETVTKSSSEPMLLSNRRLSIVEQEAQITANYTFSVANIVWLDERLPPFMTREAAFTPFKLAGSQAAQTDEFLSAETTSFGVDVTCEPAVLDATEEIHALNSSQGCRVRYPFGLAGTDIIGIDAEQYSEETKEYSPFFAGFSGGGERVQYYLSPYCPKDAANVFMLALRKNRNSTDDPPSTVTRLFCETEYYQRDVLATVRRDDGRISEVADVGPKSPLPAGLFNTSTFEEQISNAKQQYLVRGALPTTDWPDQRPQLSKLPITISSYSEMSNIFGLAVGAYPREQFEDYMDPETLASSIQAAHRLLFVRAMVDVLAANYEDSKPMNGTRVYQTEVVRVVQHFAYAVEAVLGIITIMAFVLLAVTWSSVVNLKTDPDSLSALMLLVKASQASWSISRHMISQAGLCSNQQLQDLPSLWSGLSMVVEAH